MIKSKLYNIIRRNYETILNVVFCIFAVVVILTVASLPYYIEKPVKVAPVIDESEDNIKIRLVKLPNTDAVWVEDVKVSEDNINGGHDSGDYAKWYDHIKRSQGNYLYKEYSGPTWINVDTSNLPDGTESRINVFALDDGKVILIRSYKYKT